MSGFFGIAAQCEKTSESTSHMLGAGSPPDGVLRDGVVGGAGGEAKCEEVLGTREGAATWPGSGELASAVLEAGEVLGRSTLSDEGTRPARSEGV